MKRSILDGYPRRMLKSIKKTFSPNHFNSQSVELLLMGGVGNQLFQFFAGLYLSKVKDSPLILNTSRLSRDRHQGHNILNCEYFQKYYEKTSEQEITIPGYLSLDAWHLGRLIKRNIHGKTPTYSSKVLGSDYKIERLIPGVNLHGYFQTKNYVEFLESSSIVDRHELLNSITSERVEHLTNELIKINPIFLHVRRGDYSNLSTTLGLLNSNYYTEAINSLITESSHPRQIWVLSDDFPQVKKEFSELPWKFRYLDETLDWTPLELIRLMSMSSSFVMANSTLSWWGAFFSHSENHVIAPRKWFRGIASPQDFYSDRWVKLESRWV